MKKVCFLIGKGKILVLRTFLSTPLLDQLVESKLDITGPILITNCPPEDSYGFILIGDFGI